MSNNSDFRLSVHFRNNHKIKKLEKRLGAWGVLSWISLLAFTAESRPKGQLHEVTNEDLELKTGAKNIDSLVKTLLELKLLDKIDGVFVVHDWETHNPFAVDSPERSEVGRKAAQVRWKKHYENKEQNYAERIKGHSAEHKSAMPDLKKGYARIGSDRIGSDRIGSDRIGSDRTGSDHAQALQNVPIEVFDND